jgi:hypothetical protein
MAAMMLVNCILVMWMVLLVEVELEGCLMKCLCLKVRWRRKGGGAEGEVYILSP